MKKLNEKDYMILDFIREQLETNGYPPTVREICAAVGLSSTATVQFRLNKLEDLGHIVRDTNKKRSLRLTDAAARVSERYYEIPMLDKLTDTEEGCARFALPADFAEDKDMLMLKFSGDSMINAAVTDGDYLIIRRTKEVSGGDIAAAVDDTDTLIAGAVRRYIGKTELVPQNPNYAPINIDKLKIIGVVAGVFRKL